MPSIICDDITCAFNTEISKERLCGAIRIIVSQEDDGTKTYDVCKTYKPSLIKPKVTVEAKQKAEEK